MNRLTLEEAKRIAYEKIGIELSIENRPIILDIYTLEFDWGFIFHYNGKKYIETEDSEYSYIGNIPILVDRIESSAIRIGGIGKILDSEIEKYRSTKGYPQRIKFPIKEDLDRLSPIDQVKRLFGTGELLQIEKGVELVEKHKLFDLHQFKSIVFNNAFPNWTFQEQIASQFESVSIVLTKSIGNDFPEELQIFNNSTRLNLSGVNIHEIGSTIVQLDKLKCIEIWYSEVDQISPKILEIKTLESIEIIDSKLGEQAIIMLKQLEGSNGIEIIRA